MKRQYKEMIPNILTITRAILTPITIILSFLDMYLAALILVIISVLTDMIDGKLARYFNTVSTMGAKLDVISDKIFIIGITACLCFKDLSVLPLLILEIIIALTNLFYCYKANKIEILMIGKIKTTLLFITLISVYISLINPNFINFKNGFNTATINLQIICLISYFELFYKTINKKELTIEDSVEQQNIINDTLDDKTMKIDNLIELAEKYGTLDEKDDY